MTNLIADVNIPLSPAIHPTRETQSQEESGPFSQRCCENKPPPHHPESLLPPIQTSSLHVPQYHRLTFCPLSCHSPTNSLDLSNLGRQPLRLRGARGAPHAAARRPARIPARHEVCATTHADPSTTTSTHQNHQHHHHHHHHHHLAPPAPPLASPTGSPREGVSAPCGHGPRAGEEGGNCRVGLPVEVAPAGEERGGGGSEIGAGGPGEG